MSKTTQWASPDGRTLEEFKADVHKYLGIVGVAEIAERANVKAQTVSVWRQRHEDFPPPAAELASGPVWFWADLEDWIAQQAQKGPGRPKKE